MKALPYLLTLALATLLAACGATQNHSTVTQGVTGTVTWLEGNQMPSVGPDNGKTSAKPVVRTLHFYLPAKDGDARQANGFYANVSTKLVAKTTSDEAGNFAIKLPPGKYSVFIEEADGLWANRFDGQGHINPVTVTAGQTTTLNIKIDYKAFY